MNESRYFGLLEAYIENRLTESERRELEACLIESREHCLLFWEYLGQHAHIRELLAEAKGRHFAREESVPSLEHHGSPHLACSRDSSIVKIPIRSNRIPKFVVAVGAIAAAILVVIAVFSFGTKIDETGSLAVAHLEDVEGDVYVVTEPGHSVLAQGGSELFSGQELRTEGEGSSAVVTFMDSSRLELSADTCIRLLAAIVPRSEGEPAAGKNVFLSTGSLSAVVVAQPKDHPMHLSTPHLDAWVREAKSHFASTGDVTRVEQERGSIRLTRKCDGKSIAVPTGSFAEVLNGAGPFQAQLLPLLIDRPRESLQIPSGRAYSLAFSKDGSYLACGGKGRLGIWTRDAGRWREVSTIPAQGVRSLAFLSPGNTLATHSADEKIIKFWELFTGREQGRLRGHKGKILALASSKSGRLASVGGTSKSSEAFLWDATNLEIPMKLIGHKREVGAVAFSPDGVLLATGSGDRTVNIWNVATRGELRMLVGHAREVVCLAFSS